MRERSRINSSEFQQVSRAPEYVPFTEDCWPTELRQGP